MIFSVQVKTLFLCRWHKKTFFSINKHSMFKSQNNFKGKVKNFPCKSKNLPIGWKENNCLHMLIISDFTKRKILMQIFTAFSCWELYCYKFSPFVSTRARLNNEKTMRRTDKKVSERVFVSSSNLPWSFVPFLTSFNEWKCVWWWKLICIKILVSKECPSRPKID